MKILALTNFYPPNSVGGEELSAQSIINGLRNRGHSVEVITSDYGGSSGETGVYREFKLEMEFKPLQEAIRFFTSRKATIYEDERVLEKHFKRVNPDLILIFSMWNLPRQVPALAEKLSGDRVVYRLASYWPALPSQHLHYWESPARSPLSKIPKALLARLAVAMLRNDQRPSLQLKHTICISQAVCNEYTKLGIPLSDVQIIHNGINIEAFYNENPPWSHQGASGPIKLLYVGRISPEKGIHTAIEALALLQDNFPETSLTVAGSSWGNEVLANLESLAETLGISTQIQFLGHIPQATVPQLMKTHHILLVPSIWPEPFGRVVLEGMAAGLVVIGTGQGGMGVVLQDNVTGLVFPPEDAETLAAQIRRLVSEPGLASRLVRQAQKEVYGQYTEQKMVEKFERCLLHLLESNRLSDNA